MNPKVDRKEYKGKLPCPKCSSSDAFAFYPDDNSTWCFSCEKAYTKGKYKMTDDGKSIVHIESGEEFSNATSNLDVKQIEQGFLTTVTAPLHKRRITKDTCEKYGVKVDVNTEGDVVKLRFPYFNADRTQVAIKFNVPATDTQKKKFWSDGSIDKALLFGQDKFLNQQHKIITITEGEIDCLSAYQMLGSSYPVVSLKNGAGSVKAALQDLQVYDWLSSFDKIIICFDNDEPGLEATRTITELFPPEKIHVMKLSKKDANDYLVNEDGRTFTKEWWAAKPAILDGIKNLSESREHALKPANVQKIDYPWKKLNDLTRGIRMGEATTVLSGTGQGKTSLMQELVWHIIQTTDYKIGCMFIENSERDTVNNLVGTAMSYPLKFALENDEEFAHHKFEYDAANGEGSFEKARAEAMLKTVDSGRLWSISDTDYTVNNMEKVLSRCRYFAKVLGCKVIFLDHISLLVASGEHDGDERKALDEIATKLAMIVKELGIHLFIVTQANTPTGKALEEGGKTSVNGVRGTRGIGHITHNMIGLERNGQSEEESERNTTLLRVLKCRWTGRTGPSSSLLFSHKTYRMTEVFPEDPQSNPEGADTPVMDNTAFAELNFKAKDL